MTKTYGATPQDWDHFDLVLGLGPDLLPVVSNPNATISPNSKMAALGKTPSFYNGQHQVVGFPRWTEHQTGGADTEKWRDHPDYGICIQTRRVRALDIDVEDREEADAICGALAQFGFPCRTRLNSNKRLFALVMPGDFRKRVIRTKHGIIEFLATGQQFIAVGTHPSGARYEWPGRLPSVIPEVTPEDFEKIWSALEKQFGVEPSREAKTGPTKQAKLQEAHENDATAKLLFESGSVLSTERDGRLHITCPFEDDHTGPSSDSATTYFPANTGGFLLGHFKCLHAHCEHRTDSEFRQALGLEVNDFEDCTGETSPVTSPASNEDGGADAPIAPQRATFAPQPVPEFLSTGGDTEWLVKGVLPKAGLAFIYGQPGSGKTFWALDILLHISRGLEWNGHRTHKGRCLYIAAEGAQGARKRLRAYRQYYGDAVDFDGLQVIADAPRLNNEVDRKALWQAIKPCGELDVIVVDTLAAVTPGIDENSGRDYGPVLKYCSELHKRTGALVLFVHHCGKDETKGARGWSGLRGAADCEIQIARYGDERVAAVTKLKDGADTDVEFGFSLQTVELGHDKDGDAITSCVVRHAPPGSKPQKRKEASGALARLVLKAADELSLMGNVTVNDLIERVVEQVPPPVDGKRDTRRQKVVTAYEDLLASGELDSDDGFVTAP